MKIRYDLFPNRQSLTHPPTFISVYDMLDESENGKDLASVTCSIIGITRSIIFA